MAARRRRRRKQPSVYIPIDIDIALGAGVDNAIIAAAVQTLTQDFDIYGVRAMVTFTDATPGEGPIEAGWGDNNLSAAEIKEQRDAAPTSQYDIPAVEHQRRKVRVFGTSSGEANYSLRDGEYVWKRMFLHVPAGKPLADLWALNRSGAQLTTGQIVNFHGDIVGRWK